MADRLKSSLKAIETEVVETGELIAEAGEITEHPVVDNTDQTEEFEQRVLQRCCREQQFWRIVQSIAQGTGDNIAGLINVTQAVGLIDHHQIPIDGFQLVGLDSCKLV